MSPCDAGMARTSAVRGGRKSDIRGHTMNDSSSDSSSDSSDGSAEEIMERLKALKQQKKALKKQLKKKDKLMASSDEGARSIVVVGKGALIVSNATVGKISSNSGDKQAQDGRGKRVLGSSTQANAAGNIG